MVATSAPTRVEQLAEFVTRTEYDQLSEEHDVEPDQVERIAADDVQDLLRRVEIRPDQSLSERFPQEHSARIKLHLRSGEVLEREQHDYEGFITRPMKWDTVAEKFDRLAGEHVDAGRREEIKEGVAALDQIETQQLTDLLEVIRR